MAKRTGQKTGPGDPPPQPARPAPQRVVEAPAKPAETVAAPAAATPAPAPPAPATPAPAPAPRSAEAAASPSPAPRPSGVVHPAPAAHAHPAHDSEIHEGPRAGEHHVVPVRTYVYNFIALMVFLIITLAAAAVPLGPFNLPIAIAIAVIKAGLIMLFFMHLQWSSKLVRFFALGALMWLCIMFLLTLSDYLSAGMGRFP